MNVIYVLLGCSLLLAIAFLVAFFWAVKDKQYEDDYSPSVRMLFEDQITDKTEKE